jgi:hypothetical protein
METDLNAVEMGSVGPSSTAAAAAVATTPVTSSFSTSSSSQPPLTHSSPGVISFSPMLSSTPVCRNARLPSSPTSRRRRRSSTSSAGAASTLLLAALGILCVRGFAVAAADDSANAEPLPDPVKKVRKEMNSYFKEVQWKGIFIIRLIAANISQFCEIFPPTGRSAGSTR